MSEVVKRVEDCCAVDLGSIVLLVMSNYYFSLLLFLVRSAFIVCLILFFFGACELNEGLQEKVKRELKKNSLLRESVLSFNCWLMNRMYLYIYISFYPFLFV